VIVSVNWLEGVGQDLRLAARGLRRRPGFAAAAIATLALGVGAATVMFSVVYSVLVNPFPYKNIDRAVVIGMRAVTNTGGWRGRGFFTPAEILALRDGNHTLEDLVAARSQTVVHDDGRSARLFHAEFVTPNLLDFFGVPPIFGRPFTLGDADPGAPRVFVMNHRVWQSEFGGNSDIVGQTFRLSGEPATLVGIMPARFNVYAADVWIASGQADGGMWTVTARRRPGVDLTTVAADLDAIEHRFVDEHPGGAINPDHLAMAARTYLDSQLGNFRSTLYGLLAAVLLLLLIACANVANLMLVRGTVREREMAMRASIGATRGRLIGQLLMESLVLAAAAALAGYALAYAGLKIVVSLIPPGTVPAETSIEMSAPVLWLSLILAVVTTLVCGLAPALHLVRGELQPRLAAGAKGSGSTPSHTALRSGLVVAEVALAMVLVIGAGLSARAYFSLTRVDLGFDPRNVLYIRPFFPTDYGSADKKNAFSRQMLDRMRGFPGVTAVAESMLVPPLTYDWSDTIIPGKPHTERWETRFELCSDGYFGLLGLQLLRGSLFTEEDVAAKRFVTVVNQTFARQYFPNEDPIGKQVKFQVFDRPFLDAPHDTYFQIVGVVTDHRTWGGEWQIVPQAFVPYSVQGCCFRTFLARTSVAPDSLIKQAREAIWAIDPGVGISAGGSIEKTLTDFYRSPQFDLFTLGAFGGIGLALISVGVFSVMAYTVSLRTHEIGVRMALGAGSARILLMIFAKGLRLVATGSLIGLAAAYMFSSVLASRIPGVSPTDPVTFGSVATVVLLVGLLACFLPARRATRVDPLVALRCE